jgi:hypothetical protein
MVLHLTPEQETRLAELAQHQGVSVDALLTDVALGLLDEDERERRIILQRIEQANRGEFIEEDKMDRRVKTMLAQ